MINEEAYNAFVNAAEQTNLFVIDNNIDLFVYPNISDSLANLLADHFSLHVDEEILYVRDTSFWNDQNQGTVVTDWGITIVPDNDEPDKLFQFEWKDIDHFEYRNRKLLLFSSQSRNDNIPIDINLFLKEIDDDSLCRTNGEVLADIFTAMAQSSMDPSYEAFLHIDQLIDEENYTEAIQLINQCLALYPEHKSQYNYQLSHCYSELKDQVKAIQACNAGLVGLEKGEGIFSNLCWERFLSYMYIEHNYEARKDALMVAIYGDETLWDDGRSKKSIAKEYFFDLDSKCAEHFLELPYKQRKVLMVVDSYNDLYQEHLQVFDMDTVEETKIDFPLGHPRANQIYIGHPLVPSKYIPLENYQLELVEDKVREFCMLAQSLGATEITIDCLNASMSNSNRSGSRNVSGSVDHWMADASGSYSKDFSSYMIEELGKAISLHQTFQPYSKPSLPEGLVWYQNEPSWQRLVSQRLNGNLLLHEERIETRKSQMVESREMSEIKGEFESLLLDADIQMTKNDEQQFVMQDNAVLSIHVKFAPANQLSGSSNSANNIIQIPVSSQDSKGASNENEGEYLEYYKDIIEDYGEIGPKERKRLEKDRIRLGISEARAKELEASCVQNKLSEEEKEYLGEYKEMLEDYGSISNRERKRLDKMRSRLGISESRAAELEKMS